MNAFFYTLGAWVAAHPLRVLAAWALVIGLGSWGAHALPSAAVGGTGGIEGSPSKAVSDLLRSDFTNPFIDPLIVAVSTPHLDIGQERYREWLRQMEKTLSALPEVSKLESAVDSRDPSMRAADGHSTLLLVGLNAKNNDEQQHAVTVVRAGVDASRIALEKLDPDAKVAVTGDPAADFDVNALSASGGDHAEKRALPLTLAILAVAFGTLVAASLPFLMGLATTTVALGAAFLLAETVTVSNLLSNVVTMVGLAIGIDYSLLMVTHYRSHSPQASAAQTVAGTVAEAGRTISWSGVVVMVGFLGLLWSPILETRCAGIGGALVVCISVLAALTLLPALLVLLSPYLDRWPVVPGRLRGANTTAFWHGLGDFIVRHPLPVLIVSAGSVIALATPVLHAHMGVTNERWFLPKSTESRLGSDILADMRSTNADETIQVIVSSAQGTPILTSDHIKDLFDYAARLQDDRRIGSIASPFTLQKGMELSAYEHLYANPEQALHDNPSLAELYFSRDRQRVLFVVTPAHELTQKAIEGLTRDIGTMTPAGPFTLLVGGSPAYNNDFNEYMFRSLPRIFGFVIGGTVLLLFVAFRSYLLPVKAVITNLLAVAAGIGAVVAVFQWGWLNGLVGLERPFASIPLEVPMMVFCLSFGLSMDYELFLLFQIQREYAVDGNNDRATIAGLTAVAPVITGAGLIMAVVFGAFIGADLPVLKMMGVGLCVSVLIDATVIRGLVVPAVMALAGRLNWYPGRHARTAPARLA